MRIVAYTYESDVHCPACTRKRFQSKGPWWIKAQQHCGHLDEHGLDFELEDREGNPVRPVFSTDEHDFTHCGNCHEELTK